MREFASAYSYRDFQFTVRKKARYFHDEGVRNFLEAVLQTSESRTDTIKQHTVLCRAQRGYTWRTEKMVGEEGGEEVEVEGPDAFGQERMKPNADFVLDGRVNPRGIACLYLASDAETAMAEVRPWVGSYVSLGYFKMLRDMKVVDCSKDKRTSLWVFTKPADLSPEERERVVWGDIGHALSRPITPDESPTEYVPTQILAEAFRAHGYDGIVYKSLLGEGHNIALFEPSSADLVSCGLYETESISFKFEQCSNPYFIKKYLDEGKSKTLDGKQPT